MPAKPAGGCTGKKRCLTPFSFQINLHHGGTEKNQRMLRATGCPGGQAGRRADRRTPLLIQEGHGAFATGVVTRRVADLFCRSAVLPPITTKSRGP
jgi:hypothetical protein